MAQENLSIGTYEFKTHCTSILKEVENGSVYTITRHGAPIALITPIVTKKSNQQNAIQELLKLRDEVTQKGSGVSQEVIKDWITQGQR